jgi:hypothetical protein
MNPQARISQECARVFGPSLVVADKLLPIEAAASQVQLAASPPDYASNFSWTDEAAPRSDWVCAAPEGLRAPLSADTLPFRGLACGRRVLYPLCSNISIILRPRRLEEVGEICQWNNTYRLMVSLLSRRT